MAKIRPELNYGVLEYIVIEAKHRGLNLGNALLRALLFKAESIGMKRYFIIVKNDYLFKKRI